MRNGVFGAGLLLILAACGSGTATTAPRASTPASGPTQAATAAATNSAPTGAPTTAPNPAGTIEACSLLTPAEVAAAYGEPLDTATKASDQIYSYCTYSGDNEAELKTYVTQSAAVIPTAFGTVKINKGEPVSGVGDEAFWSNDGFNPGLYFLKSGALAFIEGSMTGPDNAIVDLGKLMASRM